MLLADKAVVIVGGTSGMGWSAAQACAAAGARLVAVGPDDTCCAAMLERFEGSARDSVRAVAGDARDGGTAERAVEVCLREFGKLDGLYHVAGGSGRALGDGPADQISNDAWRDTLHWNLDSVFYSCRAALRAWRLGAAVEEAARSGGGGSLVLMSSVLATHPAPQHFATHAYAAAKSGVIGLARSLSAYYASHNVRVNVVAPGLVETPMSRRACQNSEIADYVRKRQALDGGRIGRAADVDGTVVYLLSDHSRFVTGQVIEISGGWSVGN